MSRAVIWDLDGTLIDSADYHWRSWRDTLAAEGVSLTHDQFLASFGQRNDRILRGWLGADADADRIQRIGDAKEMLYRHLAASEGVTTLPGAAEWVRRLRADGWRQAVASSAPRLNVETVLDALGLVEYFEAVVAAEDVRRGKPDPEIFVAAAGRLGVPPSRCVVVEDAQAGVDAARAAGMKCVGVSLATRLSGADLRVRSLADLPPDAFARMIER